jgi:hypothetical protein
MRSLLLVLGKTFEFENLFNQSSGLYLFEKDFGIRQKLNFQLAD